MCEAGATRAYALVCRANEKQIRGAPLLALEKAELAAYLIERRSTGREVERFRDAVRAEGRQRLMYPGCYVPPYAGGKKMRLLTGQLPKTQLLSANHYELEILRLLVRLCPDAPAVREMVKATLDRLRQTCFGRWCPTGECVGAGVRALRFLQAAAPEDRAWISRLAGPLGARFAAQQGVAAYKDAFPFWYYCLALAELPDEDALPQIAAQKGRLLHVLTRGCRTGPAEADRYNQLILHVARNALGRLEAYGHLAGAEVYVSERDGRCYCRV